MRMKMVRMVLVGMLLCSATCTSLAKVPSANWKDLREKTVAIGLTADRVDQMLNRCRQNGMSATDTETLLSSVYSAGAELLPADSVFLKIEEGLAKKVDVAQITAAAKSRLTCLRQAKQLLSSDKKHGGGYQHLMTRTCMALESGLPAAVLQTIFSSPGGFRYGRMIHVIDAGETLYLAGLLPSDIQLIMGECLDRNLSGTEILRATDIILRGHREGKSFESIHAALWVETD